ncbi:DUF885 domain-containing protein [Eudoraea chungangensis]|uniref:DUF885 domain-containing protein n=1 Tax=Eudoraea chungangensis TaxID=1481905 RepID=UPI0023EB8746|nr:DUF885 domain-containing protein [Eudoraea chungangensis]
MKKLLHSRSKLTYLSTFSLVFVFLATVVFASAQQPKDWIAESNQNTEVLLMVLAKHNPESAANFGIDGFDEEISDLTKGYRERALADEENTKVHLLKQLKETTDVNVKEDLQILLGSINSSIEDYGLQNKYLLPYHNVANNVYDGLRGLLEDRIPTERKKASLIRLKKYVGNMDGYQPMTELAKQEMQHEWDRENNRVAPFKTEIERDLQTADEYIKEIEVLFKKYNLKGYEKDYQTLVSQIADYNQYIKEEILPKARIDFKLPPEIYAFNLKEYGIDMPIEELQKRAMVSFKELQTQLQVLARQIALQKNYASSDYRDVLVELKKEQLDSSVILSVYQDKIKEIEKIIRDQSILSLPDRDMVIRLATPAESAAAPAPFMSPPRLIGNTGEYGEFVLPLKSTGGKAGNSLKIDDFTHIAASWALTAHEGRPGHELQFTAMVERGVSQARMIFAANSVNIEGWALYAEEVIQPYLPLEGQFMTLWSRLVRSARAFLDPGLNLGIISTEEARYILQKEIQLSEALVRSELERYRFRAPGQATSYFNGYLRMMELRSATELVLGEKFNELEFHDFVLSQGLLPPYLIKKAVEESFIPNYIE